jgi:pre-mRNA-splicing factor ISY1
VRSCTPLSARRARGHTRKNARSPSTPHNPTHQTNSIRDLNDEINKLIREKGHWERRIVELGGPDYAKAAPKVTADDDDAAAASGATTTAAGAGGYRYFGAAKQLPGVKEMFEKPPARAAPRRTRAQMAKGLTPDYYGFRDEDDGVLLRLERAAERPGGAYTEARMREWEAAYGGVGGGGGGEEEEEEEGGEEGKRRRGEEGREQRQQQAAARRPGAAAAAGDSGDGGGDGFAAFVPLPDRAAIESLVVAKKKRDLLARYASEASLRQQAEAAALANPSGQQR